MCADIFSGKSHRRAAWPGDTGLLGRDRRRAGLLFSSALHRPRLSPPDEEGERGGVPQHSLFERGQPHASCKLLHITYIIACIFSFLIGVAQIKCHLSEPGDKTVHRRNFGGKY